MLPFDSPPDCDELLGSKAKTKKVYEDRERTVSHVLDLARMAAQQCGVARLADITGLDNAGLPVASSIRPDADEGNITVTGGKGTTSEEAHAGAFLEAIERYCGERRGRTGVVLSLDEARKLACVEPRQLILDAASSWEETERLEWYTARDLLTGELALVPSCAVLPRVHR